MKNGQLTQSNLDGTFKESSLQQLMAVTLMVLIEIRLKMSLLRVMIGASLISMEIQTPKVPSVKPIEVIQVTSLEFNLTRMILMFIPLEVMTRLSWNGKLFDCQFSFIQTYLMKLKTNKYFYKEKTINQIWNDESRHWPRSPWIVLLSPTIEHRSRTKLISLRTKYQMDYVFSNFWQESESNIDWPVWRLVYLYKSKL